MEKAVSESGAELEVSSQSTETQLALRRKRFDLLVLDCDGDEEVDVLMATRQGCLNPHCLVLAITSSLSDAQATYDRGANFVLDKPVSMENAARTMQGALECILRERRKYFRHPVADFAQLSFSNLLDLRVQLRDLSESGAAIQSSIPLYPGWGVEMKLELKELPEPIALSGFVAWAHRNGKAGIKFMVLSEKARQQLTQWLAGREVDVDLSNDFDRVFPPLTPPIKTSPRG